MFLFEKLDVYQKSINFAQKTSVLIENFTRGNGYIIDQLQRAALSISLNIAEGNGRYHIKEKCNFFWIARGSAFECVPILELCLRKKLIDKDTYQALRNDLIDITKMISGLINNAR